MSIRSGSPILEKDEREGEMKIEEDSHSSGDWPMTENSEKMLAEEKGSRTS